MEGCFQEGHKDEKKQQQQRERNRDKDKMELVAIRRAVMWDKPKDTEIIDVEKLDLVMGGSTEVTQKHDQAVSDTSVSKHKTWKKSK